MCICEGCLVHALHLIRSSYCSQPPKQGQSFSAMLLLADTVGQRTISSTILACGWDWLVSYRMGERAVCMTQVRKRGKS
jgi:hypothetical protein